MRSLGWNRPTDKHFSACRMAGPHAVDLLSGTETVDTIDLSRFVAILDQNGLGACVLHAVAQAIRVDQLRTGAPPSTEFISRLMAYYLARCEDRTEATDAGTQVCTALDAIARVGFCRESLWPYEPVWYASSPPLECYRAAHAQRGGIGINYHRLDGFGVAGDQLLHVIDQALASGRVVPFGTLVSEDFCANNLGPDPILPPKDKPIAGGHSMALVGKNTRADGKPSYRVANSWGTDDFGDGGFCDFDPSYLTWAESSDFWMISKAPQFLEVTP